MREITRIMVQKYALNKLKYDFMGYSYADNTYLSFHHLIIPRCCSSDYGIGRGYLEWNGAILNHATSHAYLHQIEKFDEDVFYDLTSELIDLNHKGYLDLDNLKYIDEILKHFEKEYLGKYCSSGSLIVRPEFTERIFQRNMYR